MIAAGVAVLLSVFTLVFWSNGFGPCKRGSSLNLLASGSANLWCWAVLLFAWSSGALG